MPIILGYVVEGIVLSVTGLLAVVLSAVQWRWYRKARSPIPVVKYGFLRVSIIGGVAWMVLGVDPHGSWLYPTWFVAGLANFAGGVVCAGLGAWVNGTHAVLARQLRYMNGTTAGGGGQHTERMPTVILSPAGAERATSGDGNGALPPRSRPGTANGKSQMRSKLRGGGGGWTDDGNDPVVVMPSGTQQPKTPKAATAGGGGGGSPSAPPSPKNARDGAASPAAAAAATADSSPAKSPTANGFGSAAASPLTANGIALNGGTSGGTGGGAFGFAKLATADPDKQAAGGIGTGGGGVAPLVRTNTLNSRPAPALMAVAARAATAASAQTKTDRLLVNRVLTVVCAVSTAVLTLLGILCRALDNARVFGLVFVLASIYSLIVLTMGVMVYRRVRTLLNAFLNTNANRYRTGVDTSYITRALNSMFRYLCLAAIVIAMIVVLSVIAVGQYLLNPDARIPHSELDFSWDPLLLTIPITAGLAIAVAYAWTPRPHIFRFAPGAAYTAAAAGGVPGAAGVGDPEVVTKTKNTLMRTALRIQVGSGKKDGGNKTPTGARTPNNLTPRGAPDRGGGGGPWPARSPTDNGGGSGSSGGGATKALLPRTASFQLNSQHMTSGTSTPPRDARDGTNSNGPSRVPTLHGTSSVQLGVFSVTQQPRVPTLALPMHLSIDIPAGQSGAQNGSMYGNALSAPASRVASPTNAAGGSVGMPPVVPRSVTISPKNGGKLTSGTPKNYSGGAPTQNATPKAYHFNMGMGQASTTGSSSTGPDTGGAARSGLHTSTTSSGGSAGGDPLLGALTRTGTGTGSELPSPPLTAGGGANGARGSGPSGGAGGTTLFFGSGATGASAGAGSGASMASYHSLRSFPSSPVAAL